MKYANMKQIKINREKIATKETGRKYIICYQDNIANAMKNLSKSAFELYIYLLFNKDGYKLEFSPQDFSNTSGVCLKTARSCINELIEKKYITQTYDNSDKYYQFFETPQKKKNLYKQTKEFLDLDTGEYVKLTYEELIEEVGIEQAKSMWEAA